MTLEKTVAACYVRLNYIKKNCTNAYILKECGILDIKFTDIKNKKYKNQKSLNTAIDYILRNDTGKMKRVVGLDKKIVNKITEMEVYIKQIKDVYFDE